MKIQYNTDKTISGEERNETYFTDLIEAELENFESYITRIEVHISDQNGKKEGINDILCMLEARLKGKQPIAVNAQETTIELAVLAALEKLKAMLKTIVDRQQNHN